MHARCYARTGRNFVLWALLLAATGVAPLQAQTRKPPERDLVAVLDFEIEGGTKAQASALTSQLRTEMLRTGRVILVDRSQMEAILNEQAFQQTGCTSQECAVQVGKILGIRKIVTGKLVKLDEKLWQVSVVMTDVETAETLKAEAINHDGDYRSLLLQGMAKAAEALTGARPTQEAAGPRAGVINLIGMKAGDEVRLDGTALPPRRDGRYLTAAGRHTLSIRRQGFKPYTDENVDVPSGGAFPLSMDSVLEPISGFLTVTGVPRGASARITGGAEVSSQVVVTLPARKKPLPVGHYEVTVTGGDGRPVLGAPLVVDIREDQETGVSVAELATQERQALTKGVGWTLIGVGGGVFGLLAYMSAAEVHDYNTKNKKLVKEMKTTSSATTYNADKALYKSNVKSAQSSQALGEVSTVLALLSVGGGVYALAVTPGPGFEPVAIVPTPSGEPALSLVYRW